MKNRTDYVSHQKDAYVGDKADGRFLSHVTTHTLMRWWRQCRWIDSLPDLVQAPIRERLTLKLTADIRRTMEKAK